MVYTITPITTTDYPKHLACLLWFAKCNMRCRYCYNTALVEGEGRLTIDDVERFLRKRVGKLDGVVFSGGECTESKDFIPLVRKAKELGYKVKVDTNGSNLDKLKEVIDDIDYIAMDFKATKSKFKSVTNSKLYDKFIESLKYLIEIGKEFEVRTTIHIDLIDEEDINQMCRVLEACGYKGTYYLQKYVGIGDTIGGLKDPSREFNKSKIKTNIKIEYRNFN